MADDSLFLIDIDKILREKAPKQSKYIPKFVVSYLKHIVHQEELNVFLRESKDKVGVDFLKACLEFLDANIVVKGEENLPKEGLYTFVSNHPLGGQDGVALGYVLGSFYGGKMKSRRFARNAPLYKIRCRQRSTPAKRPLSSCSVGMISQKTMTVLRPGLRSISATGYSCTRKPFPGC